MLAFVVLPTILALASAAPGGYTGLGGMYKNMQMHPETMHHAKMAASMAKSIAFEQDESLRGAPAGVRPSRSSQYIPTFFTSEPQVTRKLENCIKLKTELLVGFVEY